MVLPKKNSPKKPAGKIVLAIWRDRYLYLMLLAPMALYLIFKYFPMYGIIIAFKEFNIFKGIHASQWIGLKVFQEVFTMKGFFRALRNTFILNGLDLVLGFSVPILLALMLNELKNALFKRTIQTIAYFPHFISWVIIGGMAYQIFSSRTGIINHSLANLGLGPIQFLSNKWIWLFTYSIIGIWQSTGWSAIIYLAAISGIDPQLYEAAIVDGAGRLRLIWNISLPGIRGTIIILLILRIGNLIRLGFERPYIMGNVLVWEFSEVLSTYVYYTGLVAGRYSIATAIGLFEGIVGMCMIITANALANRFGEEGLW